MPQILVIHSCVNVALKELSQVMAVTPARHVVTYAVSDAKPQRKNQNDVVAFSRPARQKHVPGCCKNDPQIA